MKGGGPPAAKGARLGVPGPKALDEKVLTAALFFATLTAFSVGEPEPVGGGEYEEGKD